MDRVQISICPMHAARILEQSRARRAKRLAKIA